MKFLTSMLNTAGAILRRSDSAFIKGSIKAVDATGFTLAPEGGDPDVTCKWADGDCLYHDRHGNECYDAQVGDVLRLEEAGQTWKGTVSHSADEDSKIGLDFGGGLSTEVEVKDLDVVFIELTFDENLVADKPASLQKLADLAGDTVTIIPAGASDLSGALTGELTPLHGNVFGLTVGYMRIDGFTTSTHEVWEHGTDSSEVPPAGTAVHIWHDKDEKIVASGVLTRVDNEEEFVVDVNGVEQRFSTLKHWTLVKIDFAAAGA